MKFTAKLLTTAALLMASATAIAAIGIWSLRQSKGMKNATPRS